VVAKAEGGVRETVIDGETGFLVVDDADLPGALERVLDDEALARRMGATARRIVESTWSLPQATDRLEAQLLLVVEKKTQWQR
jgi:glycosyltransferase involved in cell wall biosynthesis